MHHLLASYSKQNVKTNCFFFQKKNSFSWLSLTFHLNAVRIVRKNYFSNTDFVDHVPQKIRKVISMFLNLHCYCLDLEVTRKRVLKCVWNRYVIFSPFVPNTPLLYPLKTSENLTVFWCFQGGRERVHWEQMGYIKVRWGKNISRHFSMKKFFWDLKFMSLIT